MKVAVVGAGGVGGSFGGRLAEAGEDVVFLARGRTLEALRADGLRVESVAGDLSLRVRAEDDPARVGPVDLVVVAVKAWQVRAAARALGPLMGPETVVLPLQNGVEAADELGAELGVGHVLIGLCRILSEIVRPGVIRHSGVPPRVEVGERDNRRTDRLQRVVDTFARCRGVAISVPADVQAALWEKFLFISSFGGVGAVCRATASEIRSLPETRALLRAAMQEVAALAAARGVSLAGDVLERNLAFVDNLPAGATASMHRDLAEGRPSELEHQPGAVVRLAMEAAVPAPVFQFLYASLLPSERRARG
jgi:2-dehydropantoate 2-reductase